MLHYDPPSLPADSLPLLSGTMSQTSELPGLLPTVVLVSFRLQEETGTVQRCTTDTGGIRTFPENHPSSVSPETSEGLNLTLK